MNFKCRNTACGKVFNDDPKKYGSPAVLQLECPHCKAISKYKKKTIAAKKPIRRVVPVKLVCSNATCKKTFIGNPATSNFPLVWRIKCPYCQTVNQFRRKARPQKKAKA
jgi:phage FluMu protein Com